MMRGTAQLSAEQRRERCVRSAQAFFDLSSRKELDPWGELWADDGTHELVFTPEGFPDRVEGRRNVVAHWTSLLAGIERLRWLDVRIHPTTEPEVLYVEFRTEITFRGGSRYSNTYCARMDFADGKLRLLREFFDPRPVAAAFGRTSTGGG